MNNNNLLNLPMIALLLMSPQLTNQPNKHKPPSPTMSTSTKSVSPSRTLPTHNNTLSPQYWSTPHNIIPKPNPYFKNLLTNLLMIIYNKIYNYFINVLNYSRMMCWGRSFMDHRQRLSHLQNWHISIEWIPRWFITKPIHWSHSLNLSRHTRSSIYNPLFLKRD